MKPAQALPVNVSPPALWRREAPLRGYVIVLAGTVIWALTGIFIKILLTQYAMDPLAIAFWRVSLVTLCLLAALVGVDVRLLRIARRDIPLFFFYGLIGVALHQIVWIASVERNGAAIATVLIYMAPALVAMFAWRFMGETMNRTRVTAIVLTLAGCALVGRAYDVAQIQLNWVGLAAGIATAFTLGTYTLMGRALTRRYSAWTSLFYAFLFGSLCLLPFALFSRDFIPARLPLDGWATLIFLALGPTLGGFGAYTIGLSHLPASVASTIAASEPITTATIAYFLFGEVLAPLQLAGAGLILWSVLMLRPKDTTEESKRMPHLDGMEEKEHAS